VTIWTASCRWCRYFQSIEFAECEHQAWNFRADAFDADSHLARLAGVIAEPGRAPDCDAVLLKDSAVRYDPRLSAAA
jgi:hypothetical protein